MTTLDKPRQVVPPPFTQKDIEMARVAQRCIMESLDHSRAAAITLTTDSGEHPQLIYLLQLYDSLDNFWAQ